MSLKDNQTNGKEGTNREFQMLPKKVGIKKSWVSGWMEMSEAFRAGMKNF